MVIILIILDLTCDRILTYFQIKDGRWHQTQFIFQSQDPNLLPIVDVYNLPKTEPGARYHLEVGPVCFL